MSESFDYDKILSYIGSFGRSQKLLTCAVFYLCIQHGFQFFSGVLIFYEPNFRCDVSPQKPFNESSDFEECHLGFGTCNACFVNNTTPCGLNQTDCLTNSSMKCNDFVYDTSIVEESIITQYDLVCEKASLKSVSESMFLFGYLLGSVVFGDLADRYGRSRLMFYTTLFTTLCSFIATFSTNFYIFSIAKMLLSMCCVGSTNSTFIYVAELIGVKHRTLVGLTQDVAYGTGYILATGCLYAIPSHFYLQLIGSLMLVPATISLFFFPESPRWLMTMRRENDAIQVAKKLATFNQAIVEEETWEAFKASKMEDDNKKRFSYIELFKTRMMTILTMKSLVLWFTNGYVYTGIVYNIGTLSGSMFGNHLISSVIDLTACFFCGFVLISVGRRKFQIAMYLTSAISIALSTLLTFTMTEEIIWLTRALSFIARFGIMTTYTLIYIYTAELYPTVIRSVGMNSGSLLANLGGTVVPYVLFTQNFVWWLPNLSFIAFICLSTAIQFTLPETKSIKLMQTVEDAELFYAK